MSQVGGQCVYSQIQRYSLTQQKHRSFGEQALLLLLTRAFDVAITVAAATAAVAAGANAANVPLTRSMLQAAAVGGAVKSGAMSFAGVVLLAPVNSLMIVLPALLATSVGTNVVLVAAVANRVLGHTPNELLIASLVASIPLSFCLLYYYGGFRVPITLTAIAFDVLGAYAFVKMAERNGYHVCAPRTAMIAGAVFGTVYSFSTTMLSCCVIGRSRTIRMSNYSGLEYTHATAQAGCCGSRVWVNSTTDRSISQPGTQGRSMSTTTGVVYNTFHGLGALWDPGTVNGHVGFFHGSTNDNTTTNTTMQSTSITFN